MSFQQKGKVISLPPDPPRVNNDNNNYICIKYCLKGLDHLNGAPMTVTWIGLNK